MAFGAFFSSTNDPITIQNSQDPQHSLLTINLSNITKLLSTNYLTWSLQIQSLLEGYDLHHFIDDTHTPPPPIVTVTGRQDCLSFSTLLGAISISLQPLIACTTTSLDAWQTLANTYAKPSCGHVKQLKEQLKWCTKGSKSISEYMQAIKTRADEFAILGKPIDDEDLIDQDLEGLSDEYKSIIDAINARDTSISFAEIHEKLLNKEASFQTAQPSPLSLPSTTNPIAFRNRPNWRLTTAFSPHDQRQAKPYLGRCQACGSDDIMIDDGSTLPITHTGSTTIPTSSRTFTKFCYPLLHIVMLVHVIKYYVIFVDHYTWYIWYYPLKRKSHVYDVFVRFKALVENQFKHQIVTVYSDNGGEYQALDNFLSTNGISHLTTPPHTPEHNGISERRHRHIIETSLSLLTHASMPLIFWTYAFATVVYLINRMPTPTLHLSSPFDKLFESPSNYTKLQVFGCLCYPWLCPYSQHKLDSRSTLCVFLGYFSTQVPISVLIYLELHTVNQALINPKWRQAMNDEFDALVQNETWELVPSTSIPVVKLTTIRLVLSLAASKGWQLRQLDVDNAFLQGHLFEDKVVYGLKQAPRAWYLELHQFLIESRFTNSHADTSLFILHSGDITIYLLVYLDDIIITGTNTNMTSWHKDSIKDLGALSYFLDIEVLTTLFGVLLTQRHYISDLLAQTKMSGARPVATPLVTYRNLTLHSSIALTNCTEYRTLIGNLQYLCLTHPDILYAINKLSQFMHRLTSEHWNATKLLLRYLCGTLTHGLFLYKANTFSLHAFSDADWAGNKDNYTSMIAYIVYLGCHPISWSSKKQLTATTSEINWICSFLTELSVTLPTPPVIYCDNVGATYLCSNPVFHSSMKYVAIDYHFIRDQVQSGALRVTHFSLTNQFADALTKPLS
uniref:Integrase catalytic domain-containing protein n=1 Tax=Vitis vinifera TaxID=29760 RepID=A5AY51_VITVI|nr:hypothetical protein VITISV_023041 [Vitis vinifera]